MRTTFNKELADEVEIKIHIPDLLNMIWDYIFPVHPCSYMIREAWYQPDRYMSDRAEMLKVYMEWHEVRCRGILQPPVLVRQ